MTALQGLVTRDWPGSRATDTSPIAQYNWASVGYNVGRACLVAYMRLMLKVDVLWHAPLPEGPKILAANHPTTTDPFYILTLLSESVSVLVTASAFDVPVFGHYLRATGHVPAIRSSGGATVAAVARQVEVGHSVAIFPEGTLSPLEGSFHRPHSGVARVALRTGAPVIPVGIGLQRNLINFVETGVEGESVVGHLYLRGPYAMTVGQPLYFEGNVHDHKRVRAVTDHIMSHIQDLAHESEYRIRSARVKAAGIPVCAANVRGWR